MFTAMQEGDNVTVEVSITRHYGSFSITLGAAVPCEIGHEAAYQRAYNEITDTLLSEHKRQAERLRPTESRRTGPPSSGNQMSQPSPDGGADPSSTTRRFPAEFVVIEEKDRKRYYKIAGGNFLKHGVRIWREDEEVMLDFPHSHWDTLPTGRHAIEPGWEAVASMAGRNPVKVIHLVPKNVEF